MVCRGIQRRANIGYLSQLEALRYCQVGAYYKSPYFPVWVVGSSSHFSVLFGERSALAETQSDMLLEQCRSVFKRFDDDNGFIQSHQLGSVYELLSLELKTPDDKDRDTILQLLAANMEVTGAGIILWY